MRTIPSTFSGEQRRRVAYRSQAGACSLRVPLWHHNPKGEWVEGRITVSARLAHAEPNSNQYHERDRAFKEQLRKWAEWREKRGWKMVSKPQIQGPFEPPTENAKADPNEDIVYYVALARFVRITPLYVGLDDFLHQREQMEQFGVQLEDDPLPWNNVSGTEDTGWMDPMKYAEEQRQKMGVKRKDYLIPKLHSPESLEAILGS